MKFAERHRYGASLLAGGSLALCFPLPGWSGLAFIAPGVLAVAGIGLRPMEAFRVGYVAGLIGFLGSLRWLLHIPFPAGAVAGWLALSAYCAFYPGLWLVGLSLAAPLMPLDGVSPRARLPSWAAWAASWLNSLEAWAAASWWQRSRWFLFAGASWVALEMARGWVFGGFPWNLLGSALYRNIPLVQLAAWTGIYGLSFVIVWGSLGLTSAIVLIAMRPDSRWSWTGELRVPLLSLLVIGGIGLRRVMNYKEPVGDVRLALIQPSIPQMLMWDSSATTNRFEQIRSLSEQALAAPADVLVWPEASLPDIGRDQFGQMLDLVRKKQVHWVFGGDESDDVDGQVRVYNSAYLMDERGRLAKTYRKRRLVIFGEYIPLERWFPFMRWLTPIGGSFSEGTGPVAFPFGTNGGVASPLICFEPVFPNATREYAAVPEVNFLLELTNDGWFGESSAQWQHLASGVFRAVETGMPLVRCTNNGITGWVDPCGRLRAWIGARGESVYDPGYLRVTVPIGGGSEPTVYREAGERFGWGCWIGSVLGMGRVLLMLRSRGNGRKSLDWAAEQVSVKPMCEL